MMSKYIYWLLLMSGWGIMFHSSVWSAQIHTDILPNSSVSLSYVSSGQLAAMSLTNHASLRQFVPYSDTNGIAYTCTPSSWLSYLSNPVGQPLMWSAPSRWLTVSCSTQCGPLMRWTAYGDEANNAYCADGSPKTFVAVTGSTDKLHWTCGSSPTQCRAYKWCLLRWGVSWQDPIASTTPTNGGGDIFQIRVDHDKAIQFGNRSVWSYGDDGMLRCQWGQFYPHTAGMAMSCNTPLWISFTFGPYGQNISLYGYHRNNTITNSPEYILDTSNNGVVVFSVQSSAAYCDMNGCPATWAYDPYDNGDWVYGPSLYTAGTCPYSWSISSN